MNKQVTDYIENAPAGHKEILEELRKIIHQNIEGVEEFYKVRRPVFRKGEDFAYIRDSSKYVALGLTWKITKDFWREREKRCAM